MITRTRKCWNKDWFAENEGFRHGDFFPCEAFIILPCDLYSQDEINMCCVSLISASLSPGASRDKRVTSCCQLWLYACSHSAWFDFKVLLCHSSRIQTLCLMTIILTVHIPDDFTLSTFYKLSKEDVVCIQNDTLFLVILVAQCAYTYTSSCWISFRDLWWTHVWCVCFIEGKNGIIEYYFKISTWEMKAELWRLTLKLHVL